MKWRYLRSISLFVLLAGCGQHNDVPPKTPRAAKLAPSVAEAATATTDKSAPSANPVNALKPEMVVRFPQSSIACLTKEALLEISMHALNGEQTKAEAMMVGNDNPNGQCIMLSSKQKVKIISVAYNNPDTPELGLLEVVGQHTTSSQGAWVYSVGAVPVRN